MVVEKGTVVYEVRRGGEDQRRSGCLWATEVCEVFLSPQHTQVPYEIGFVITPLLQMEKLRVKEMK